jgi:NAD(P)-dependent dehydrogenase (short-subunit alcohol dehydrogenase family)
MSANETYFHDKVAIVTGGASGIGLALAEAILSLGAAGVTLLDRDGDALDRQAGQLGELHAGRVISVQGDVTVASDVAAAVVTTSAQHHRADFLFNNAGAGFSGPFAQMTDGAWARALALNFYDPCSAIAPSARLCGSRAQVISSTTSCSPITPASGSGRVSLHALLEPS